jgi:hypothetical protein
VLVGAGEEEHVEALHERTVLGPDHVGHLHVRQPVREPPAVEAVLQLAAALVIELAHAQLIGS